jgi:hypothetical protein
MRTLDAEIGTTPDPESQRGAEALRNAHGSDSRIDSGRVGEYIVCRISNRKGGVMSEDSHDHSRREVLSGVLTASAAAVAMWAVPSGAATQPPARVVAHPVAPQTFSHSKFAGGAAIARNAPVFENINGLISHISMETKVPEQTVHQILSMAYPSIANFIGRSQGLSPAVLAKMKVGI